ncbi:MAG TPA: hypothetical protein DEG17_01210 [Cyanobacteria bacterium UBA11149]|nr:hypothetical protein [Cyanobacteria bacterium UBA11367]HBE56123.1 hypothetical protein [Cyanobacteria bacterium UBA11366]HBK64798.1 hypothetical protein [Cyanobacteria bacterium UBA11166]HBR76012.1 hypothetical protein [Cyanobacteria bacterium UBA11159]HBS72123.1 hypothetical protein [Cyanobacteria bacterium UBA11153]HBW87532.1 hypothetical protein [Cyanobacteria bacterium UBA11149]HCA96268.1 hypothetical protein [Cyanobacteria bacterium UBA9226]
MELTEPNREQNVNLMDLMFDDDWFEKAVADEEGCNVSAGGNWGENLGLLIRNPAGYSNFIQLRQLVMGGLKELLAESNLGVGMVAAMTCGQKLLSERLENCSFEVQEQLWTMLTEKLGSREVSPSNRIQLRSLLCELLTREDWDKIATAAGDCVQQQVIASASAV